MKFLRPIEQTFTVLAVVLLLERFFHLEPPILCIIALLLQLLSSAFWLNTTKEKLIGAIPFVFVVGYYLFRGQDSYQFSMIYVVFPLVGTLLSLLFKDRKFQSFPIIVSVVILGLSSFFIGDFYTNWRKLVSKTNQPFPEIYLQDNGQQVSAVQIFKGKYTVLDFWFIGCSDCVRKFPILAEKQKQYADNQNINFYSVNVPTDVKPDEERADDFLQKRGYDFKNIVTSGFDEVLAKLKIGIYPTVLVLDPKGQIVFRGSIEDIDDVLK